jgi:2-alkenal reductase
MYDPRYSLESETKAAGRDSRLLRNAVLIGLLALTLVLGAFYGPLLWQDTPIAASPALQDVPAVPAPDTALVADQTALANLFDAIAPSVVSIEVAAPASAIQIPGIPQDQLPDNLVPPADEDGLVPQGQGSGWIYDDQGHIVTNNHVVEGAQRVTVIFYDGTWSDAEVVATDPQADLAVLHVDPAEGFPWRPLVLADPDALRVGHSVIAIGNPFGLASTMTTGIVSALGRSFPVGGFGESRYTLPDVIQTDAAINPGNSGGPLVNLSGQLVGVNFAIESTTRTNTGVGFAIPASIVERVVPALINDGSFAYPYLGLSGTSVTPALARQLDLENTQLGAYVATVVPGGPAAEAGIQEADPDTNEGGDLIISFNGEPVRSFDDLVAELVTTGAPGQTATLGIIRDGQEISVDIVVGERPGAEELAQESEGQAEGISARDAIDRAEQAVEGQLEADIVERTATPEERDGREVWVVELVTDTQRAVVVLDRLTGDVVALTIE